MTSPRTPGELAEIVSLLAVRPDAWMARVRLRADRRWYERLHRGADSRHVWLIAWLPGQATGFHDHGASSGAFAVVLGLAGGHHPQEGAGLWTRGSAGLWTMIADDVRNTSNAPAISIHAYRLLSPR